MHQKRLVGVEPGCGKLQIFSSSNAKVCEVNEQGSKEKKLQVEAVPIATKMKGNLQKYILEEKYLRGKKINKNSVPF